MAKAGANIVLYDIDSGQIPDVGYPVSTESDLQSAKAKIDALKKMMPNDPNPTFDKLSELLKPGNPIAIGHLEAIDIAKAMMFFASPVTAKVTGEVFDISYGSTAKSIA
jgi:hypothetical protein